MDYKWTCCYCKKVNEGKVECQCQRKEQESITPAEDWLRSQLDKAPVFGDSRDDHRKEYSDIEWAQAQPKGAPNFMIGDVVEFHVGGFGVISKVSNPDGGWPSSYAADEIEGKPYHKKHIHAWHYEGDFKTLVAPSALRSL